MFNDNDGRLESKKDDQPSSILAIQNPRFLAIEVHIQAALGFSSPLHFSFLSLTYVLGHVLPQERITNGCCPASTENAPFSITRAGTLFYPRNTGFFLYVKSLQRLPGMFSNVPARILSQKRTRYKVVTSVNWLSFSPLW